VVSGNKHPMDTTGSVGDNLQQILRKLREPPEFPKWKRGSKKSEKKGKK